MCIQSRTPEQSCCTISAMKLTVLLFALVLSANAQSAGDKPAETRVFTVNINGVDPKLHADVLQLMELSATREKFEAQKKTFVEEGRKKLVEKCPKCSPEFGNEWAKRMLAGMKTEEFMNVYVSAYEKHLTQEDVTELIEFQQKTNAHEQVVASPRLREKLQSVMPALMGDIMGGCVKLGAELGGKVGAEIEKEHPEYLKNVHSAPQHQPERMVVPWCKGYGV